MKKNKAFYTTDSTLMVLMRFIVDDRRNTDICVISEGEMPVEQVNPLIGAYINAYDYYGKRPFVVFSINKPMKIGKVFQDVYLLNTTQIPEHNTCFLANGEFLRNCLPKEIKNPVNGEAHPIHLLDGIKLIFDSPDGRERLADIQKDKNCFFIGVYGNDPIHLSRGI